MAALVRASNRVQGLRATPARGSVLVARPALRVAVRKVGRMHGQRVRWVGAGGQGCPQGAVADIGLGSLLWYTARHAGHALTCAPPSQPAVVARAASDEGFDSDKLLKDLQTKVGPISG
jgi:hypothetical protein